MDLQSRVERVDAALDEASRLRERVEQLSALRAQESQRLHDQVTEGRQIAHAVKGELQGVMGTLEMIRAEGTLPTPHLREIGDAIERLGRIATLFERLHAMIRHLDPLL